ncbi:unnamed protein product [Phyllotreta striolata]|uniref:Protein SON n=1 Tax=Phyllotreta striolata TaxID=444603 RepID=A0A9N9TYC0_PHYSR|nr:unnamed protein product [Phyllotreta striolata]
MSEIKEEENETKPCIPLKSSTEILSELFSTFHAKPPLIIKKEKLEKSEESSKKHKKKKKHKSKDKKHRKKEKKKKRSSSSSSFSDEAEKIDLAHILIKQEKELAEKKIKNEFKELIKTEKDSLDSEKCDDKPEVKPKIEEYEEGEASNSDSSKKKKKHKPKKRSRSKSTDDKRKKIKIELKSDPYDKYVGYDKEKSKEKEKYRRHSKERHHERCDRSKDRERNSFYTGKSKDHERDRHKDRERHRDRSRERYRDEYNKELEEYRRTRNKTHKDDDFYKNGESEEKWFMRERYRGHNERDRRRSPSNDRDSKFDKKKLLEIARKNAITMMKSGSLPGALTLGPQAQEKVIAAIKSGGKTIEELTDFCKTLSKKEELGELSSLSEKDDTDSDTDKPFHHPFQLKDRPTSITMNIKNSVPLPVKSALERTSELRIQFPVSSGQHHRKGEEWLPVSPPVEKKPDPAPSTAVPLAIMEAPAPVKAPVPPAPLPPEDPPTVPAPPNAPPGPQVFPTPLNQPSVDIGSIVSQRLSAMRRLQENPNDVQALTQMYKSNKEMQSWATSKQQLGQFTGSTGAQILSQAELSSGYQAWAKKDQLQTAAPVSGGMGMHLLQKMGWKPGEGLGKDRTGALEPLLLEVKLDKKGLVANEEQRNKKKQKAVASVKNFQGKHPVSLLGEYASKKKLGAPQYVLEFECGPDHKKNFLFKVILNGVEYKPNVASNNKKEAKAAAATICLQQIGLLPT